VSFADIRDQRVAVRLLRNMILRDRVAHGLLFHGPSGVGKRLTSMTFAKALNCEQGDGDACGTCLQCRKVDNNSHPDVRHIEPAGKARDIKMEVVDFINDLSAYRPFEGRHRIFIIQDAERMNLPAQNHFLKTLEEPPSATLFLLLTEHPQLLLPTIISRCQQILFGALRPETVGELLLRERADLSEDAVRTMARLAEGQMSRAMDLITSDRRNIVLSVVERLGLGEDPLLLAEEFSKHLKSEEDKIKQTVKARYKDQDQESPAGKEDRAEAEAAMESTTRGLIRREVEEYLYLFASWYRDEMALAVSDNRDLLMNWNEADKIRPARSLDGGKIAAIDKARTYLDRFITRDRVIRDLFFELGR